MNYNDVEIKLLDDPDDVMIATIGFVKAVWTNIGEGWEGDYNPDDPEDENLLRFDVYYLDANGEWQPLDCASYCTQMPADAEPGVLKEALKTIAYEFYNALDGNMGEEGPLISVKHLGESLSWISPADIKNNTLPMVGNYRR